MAAVREHCFGSQIDGEGEGGGGVAAPFEFIADVDGGGRFLTEIR